ncbi:hypothetical protein BH23CHL5_BH23CHL5_13870 [soil metagenome]
MEQSSLTITEHIEPEFSPSGLPTRHIVSERIGATGHFVAEQVLEPGQEVYRHHHDVEESLIFLSGTGIASIENSQYSIAENSSAFIPPGVIHGFQNTGGEPMRLLVLFPVPYFADTWFEDVNRQTSEHFQRSTDSIMRNEGK